ncbi:MAG: Metal transport system membrane protein, partial [Candidatus Peregrinibacteria bacterium GW2011_GWA2_44_7]
ALVLISLAHGLNADLFSYLFGSITTVTRFDLMLIGGLGIVILGVGISFYKELFFITFDEELATADGLPTTFLNTLLIVLTALTVSVAMRIVGALLISALMVIPVLTAFQFKWSFQKTMACAVGASLVAVVTGLIGSFYLDIAPGGSIVVVALGLFLLALGWNRGK